MISSINNTSQFHPNKKSNSKAPFKRSVNKDDKKPKRQGNAHQVDRASYKVSLVLSPDLRECLNQMRGASPSVLNRHSRTLMGYLKQVDAWMAQLCIETMKKESIKINQYIFSCVISKCGKANQCDVALRLMDDMKASGLTPNVITYNATISAGAKGGQWERALELINEMKESALTPNVITYSAAISACEKGGQWERALALSLIHI